MSEKVSIKVPAALAGFVRPEAAEELKLRVVRAELEATPLERATLLFFLCHDKNPRIKTAAISAMRGLPLPLVMEIASSPATHPRMVDLIARLFWAESQVLFLLGQRGDLLPSTSEFLTAKRGEPSPPGPPTASVQSPDGERLAEGSAAGAEEGAEEGAAEEGEGEEPCEGEEEAFRSKYQLAQTMGVGEKIKTALTGDKEWRSLLIKDTNKLVTGAVVKNPRITESEILAISKSVIQNDEIIRIICQNKEWIKNYEIRKALVLNNKTPLPVALRYMGTLSEKDLGSMAKSKNISSVLANSARRILAGKKKH